MAGRAGRQNGTKAVIRTIRANLATGARYETEGDSRYLIAPAVLLVEDVLFGSNYSAPELVPLSELEAVATAWNGKPIVVNHPKRNGKSVMVSTGTDTATTIDEAIKADLLETEVFGEVRNVRLDGGRLRAELRFDEARARQVGEKATRLLAAIAAGEPVELSTGYFCVRDEQPGVFNGSHYAAIQRAITPDHLAILPLGMRGACDFEMGCGVRANGGDCGGCDKHAALNVLAKARKPTYDGIESTAWSAPGFSDYMAALHETGTDAPASLAACSMGLKRQIANHSLLGDPSGSDLRDVTMFPVVNPKTGKLNENALKAVLGGRGTAANIPAVAKASAQKMARQLLRDEFDMATAANLRMEFRTNQVSDADLRTALEDAIECEGGADCCCSCGHYGADGECSCTVFIAAVFSDRVVYRIGYDGDLMSEGYTADETGTPTMAGDAFECRPLTEFVPVEPTPAAEPVTNSEVTTMETPATTTTPAPAPAPAAATTQTAVPIPAVSAPTPAANAKPPTVDEFLATAPEDVRAVLNEGLRLQAEKRDRLVTALTANANCAFSKDELTAMPIAQLEKLGKLATVNADFSRPGPQATTNTHSYPTPPPFSWDEPKATV